MVTKTLLTDGTKSIPLDKLPPEAWTVVGGGDSGAASTGKYYSSVGWLYRAVQVRAAAAGSVPWAIVKGEDDVWTSDEEAPPPALGFLSNLRDLLFLTEAGLCLSPEAFWFIERNRVRPLSLRWMKPDSVIPQWDDERGLTHFRRILAGGQGRDLDLADIVYFAHPNPLHETQPGTPPAMAAASAAGVLYSVDQFVTGFFERGAIKATLLTVEGNPAKGEMDKLEAWWKRFFRGVGSAWESAAVRAGVTPVIVGDGIKELSNVTLTQEQRETISTTMGIPHSLMLSNAANFATAQQDEQNFYNMTVLPSCRLVANTINRQLLAPLGYALQFRPQAMSVFQEDEEQRSGSLVNLRKAGMPMATALAVLGYEVPDGMHVEEVPPVPVAADLSLSDDGEPDPTAKADDLARFKRWAAKRRNPDPDAFKSDVLTYEDKAAVLYDILTGDADSDTMPPFTLTTGPLTREWVTAAKAMILQLDPDDDEAEQKIRMEIERQFERELAAALKEQGIAVTATDLNSAQEAIQRAAEHNPKIRDILRRRLQQSADLGVFVAVDQFETIGLGIDWTLANQAAAQWVERYTFELVRGIENTTRTRLQTAVTEWVNNGDPLSELTKELQSTFGKRRATMIAQTETTRAYAEANRIAYRESGVVEKIELRNAEDEKVCPVCGPRGGMQTSLNNPDFDGYGLPPLHVACRCWVVPVIEDPQP